MKEYKQKDGTNIFNYPAKKYSSYIFDETLKYQKQYNFDIGTGKESTHNNQADAFKHTYMQAQLALWGGKHIAKILGDRHEKDGNKNQGQPQGEENMDKWNNHQGRQIASEIIREYGVLSTIPSAKINDIIAQKVLQRMNDGDLITTPEDQRKYKEGETTGQAAPIEPHIFTSQEIGKMTPEEFAENESQIMAQMKDGLIINEYPSFDYDNYKNPLSGNHFVFTREDIDKMSTTEYSKNEKDILAQMHSIGIPSKRDVSPKTKTYGSQKARNAHSSNSSGSGDGKWVTINGNHVFIEN